MSLTLLPFLEKHLTPDEPFILACSTWADSMFLLYHILQTPYKKNMVAAYFNHNTREQCKQEEEFLLELWKKEGFQVEIAECNFEKLKTLSPSRSFEELAREKRYQFFDALCHIHTAKKVFLAHHLDDRIETMIFNMLRGTKLTWLINMQENSWSLLRPLLGLEKKEILNYLQANKLPYFEDQSNAKNKHTRNFIRNEMIPLFEQVHPENKKNLSHLLGYFEDMKDFIDENVTTFLWDKREYILKDFLQLSLFLQKEILRHLYFISNNNSTIWLSEWNIAEILRFFSEKKGKGVKEIHGLNLNKEKGVIYF